MERVIRIFTASPNDVMTEREAVRRAVAELDETLGSSLSCKLSCLQCESHVFPDAGRPQAAVTDQYGRGSSVARLRKRGIGANEIDEIVDRTRVSVVARR